MSIPAGSLAFSGGGPPTHGPQVVRFVSASGADLGAGPVLSDHSGSCDGLVALDGGAGYGASGLDNDAPFYEFLVLGADFGIAAGDATIFGQSLASNYTSAFYTITRATDTTIQRYDTAAVRGTAWLLQVGIANAILCLAVSPDDAIAYYGEQDGDTVHRYSLAGSSGLSDLVTLGGGKLTPNSLLCLRNGNLLVGWSGTSVVLYDPSGGVLATHTLTGATGGPDGDRLALAADDADTSFWVWFYTADAGIRVQRRGTLSGTILDTFDKSLADYPWNGPFCRVTSGLEDRRLSVPVRSYTPYTTVLRSPTLRHTR